MKEYKNFFTIILFISGIGLIMGTFLDFRIAEIIFNPNNKLCVFLEFAGYYPLYIPIPLLCSLIMIKNKNKLIKCFSYVIGGISLSVIIICGIVFLKHRNVFIINYYLSIFISIIASFALQIVIYNSMKKLSENVRDKLFIICLFGVLLIIWKVIIISGLKILMGRARYCNIINGDGYYTPWYIINRPRMGKSFPSGHVGGACGILNILLVPILFKNTKKYKSLLEIIAAVYIIMLAFSRMVIGKHMLSDVSAAVFIMITGFMFLLNIFEKSKKLLVLRS